MSIRTRTGRLALALVAIVTAALIAPSANAFELQPPPQESADITFDVDSDGQITIRKLIPDSRCETRSGYAIAAADSSAVALSNEATPAKGGGVTCVPLTPKIHLESGGYWLRICVNIAVSVTVNGVGVAQGTVRCGAESLSCVAVTGVPCSVSRPVVEPAIYGCDGIGVVAGTGPSAGYTVNCRPTWGYVWVPA